jgi:hypothetical protein
MNMNQLVARDPALAALLGSIPGHDFGYSRPAPMQMQGFRPPMPMMPAPGRFGVGFGDDYGYGFGQPDYGFGAPGQWGFGAPKPHAMAHHPQHPHHPAHHPVAHFASSTAGRTLLLDPNRDSTVKVERYSFSLSPAASLVLGTASSMGSFTANPSTSIKGQRVVTNAPAPGFVTLDALQIANVNVFVGTTEDAYTYNATAQNVVLDLPRLDPQNRATASGDYTGMLPAGFSANAAFKFIITLQGPATLAGGYGQ